MVLATELSISSFYNVLAGLPYEGNLSLCQSLVDGLRSAHLGRHQLRRVFVSQIILVALVLLVLKLGFEVLSLAGLLILSSGMGRVHFTSAVQVLVMGIVIESLDLHALLISQPVNSKESTIGLLTNLLI